MKKCIIVLVLILTSILGFKFLEDGRLKLLESYYTENKPADVAKTFWSLYLSGQLDEAQNFSIDKNKLKPLQGHNFDEDTFILGKVIKSNGKHFVEVDLILKREQTITIPVFTVIDTEDSIFKVDFEASMTTPYQAIMGYTSALINQTLDYAQLYLSLPKIKPDDQQSIDALNSDLEDATNLIKQSVIQSLVEK